jgi:hypothetical protein
MNRCQDNDQDEKKLHAFVSRKSMLIHNPRVYFTLIYSRITVCTVQHLLYLNNADLLYSVDLLILGR